SLFVISDGVGSSQAGEIASAEAVTVLLHEYYFGYHSDKVPERLKESFRRTALHTYDLAQANKSCSKMMCTLSALLIRQNKFYISHVGDSKIFLLRDKKLIQLTKDHSVVSQMVRMGLISKQEAKYHPSKHVILRSLGDDPIIPVDFYSGNVLPNDIFLLSTDGIFEHFEEDEIRDFLIKKKHLTEGISKLIEIANERGGYDNMTVMTVDTDNI
ncbi:MAG: protein phosphatase 2C domain-containing protein, partial [Bacillota bacterium]|nr:protein phosphatase 2C domain-containing protein [Bacillota bacterium]